MCEDQTVQLDNVLFSKERVFVISYILNLMLPEKSTKLTLDIDTKETEHEDSQTDQQQ